MLPAIRAAVICPLVSRVEDSRHSRRGQEARSEEALGLAQAIGLEVAVTAAPQVQRPNPATLIGRGQVETIAEDLEEQKIALAVVDSALTPTQQRNLERDWHCKVIDRTGLILEIFGARAQTREGQLQVERAALSYQCSRLVRSWTHLERQRGGFGFLGGPGESQLEIDRRLIAERIERIDRDLAKVGRMRAEQRKARALPVAALVGYTNAGKSTLFNRLTKANVRAQDLLFATLDPTMRRVELPGGRGIVLSDTVGFISDLPTQLVAAFRATLEEVVEADIILHVRDIGHPDTALQCEDVERVLVELGCGGGEGPKPIEVWNKIDSLSAEDRQALEARRERAGAVTLSALTGESVDSLLEHLDRYLGEKDRLLLVELPASEGRLHAWLHEEGKVLAERSDEQGHLWLDVRVSPAAEGRLRALAAERDHAVRVRHVKAH
ncbi:MAG: GTPase HflX [Rhodospirillales bacterium]|nr:GTPase HflX [Rhodospirillales bacterium]